MIKSDGLSEQSLAIGIQEYVKYCSGVYIAQYPEKEASVAIHNRPEIAENVDQIWLTAMDIMVGSSIRIMHASHLPQSGNLSTDSFGDDEPRLRQIVDSAIHAEKATLVELNKQYPVFPPAPFLNSEIYTKIVQGRFNRIKLPDLMGVFVPDKIFADIDVEYHRGRTSQKSSTKAPITLFSKKN